MRTCQLMSGLNTLSKGTAKVTHKPRFMQPNHLPSAALIAAWPKFTLDDPMNVLVSGCLAGMHVGFDGSTYGEYPEVASLLARPNVKPVPFCPENFSFGTPRLVCDIEGGTGHDVLAGRARVLSADGDDWTAGMIKAAHEMLRVAHRENVHVAILMDISAACGSQVIYDGARRTAPYRAAHGVCAALLIQNNIPVVSQRDFRTLHAIQRKLAPAILARTDLRDHHESPWYQEYFGEKTNS